MILRPFARHMALSAMVAVVSTGAVAAERRYSVSDFDEVKVIGSHVVDIRTGRATTVSASGDAASLDGVSIETQGRILVIQSLARTLTTWQPAAAKATRVTITLPLLRGLRLQGSGSIAASEMRAPQTSIALTGTGQIAVTKLVSDNANIRLAGSGNIRLAGVVKNFAADIKGSGDLEAAQLTAADLKIVSATSGQVTVQGQRSADIKQMSAGQVTILGKPGCTVESIGSGSVNCGE